MGEIEKEIESLKSLLNSDLLDEKSKEDIKTTLTMFDSVKEYDLNGGTNKISINYINKSPNKNPEYATSGSAGFDFRAHVQSPTEIPGCDSGDNIRIIPTGLYFELPEGLELQVRPRSGLAAKHGITVLNSPGTVDSDYRGEVGVILINHKQEPFTINPGDRIAQGVIASCVTTNYANLVEVKEIGETERGEGKFGSTGVN